MTAKSASLIYLLLLVPSLFLVVFTWQGYAPGRLFYCDDSFGLDFWPPFAHLDESPADRFFVPASQVYRIWGAFLLAAFLLPVLALALIATAARGRNPERAPTRNAPEEF